uniref:mitogen-activated protein kinase kinase n=1 Tax=Acrobeloides nanus TaxID=290746 RepID=A0A914E8Z4_9BILA
MAVKIVLMPHYRLHRAIDIHKELSTISNNIVQYYGWCKCDGGVKDDMESIYICMELMDMSLMDLASQFQLKKKDFPVPVLGYLSFIVIDTLEQCIKRRIIHGNIKPTKILINKNGLVKLCDFGQARKIIDEASTLKGTPQYWPPECWDNNGETEYDERRDIWSYGITILKLIYGDSPYKDYPEQEIDWIPGLERVKNANGRQLVDKCLKGKETYAEMKSFLLQTLETYEKRAKYDVLKKDKFIQTYSTWTPEVFKKELEMSELMNDSPTTSNRSPMEPIDDPQEKKLPPVQEESMEFQPNNISSQSDDPRLPLIPPEQNSPRRPSLESQRSSQSNNSRSLLIPPGQESGDPPRGPSLESQSNETLSEDSESHLVLCHGMSKKYIWSLEIVVFVFLLLLVSLIWYFMLRGYENSKTTTTTHSIPSTISPQKCPDSFSYFQATNACYYVNYGNATWNTARIECLGLFRSPHRLADLVSIQDEAEDKRVKELAPDSKLIAIGLYAADASKSGEADYTWMDKTSKTYTHWKTGVPRKERGEHCVYKEQDGDWNVYDCNMVADIAYVCKYYP